MADVGDEPQAIRIPPIQIQTETRTLKTPPFNPSADQITTGRAWEEWLEGIEREFRYFRITEAVDKQDALIIYGGRDIARLAKSLPDPTDPQDNHLDEYQKLKKKLNNYYTPKKNKHHARYLFLKMKPTTEETTLVYAARLREKAQNCEFGENCEERILEHLIQTSDNQSLIQKAINKAWNLDQFLMEATQAEDTKLQVRQMRSEHPDCAHKVFNQKFRYKEKRKPHNQHTCTYCGQVGTHDPGRNCPAYRQRCKRCGRMGHFQIACRAEPQRFEERKPQKKEWKKSADRISQGGRIKRTSKRGQESSTSSDEEFFEQVTRHVSVVKKVGEQQKTVLVVLEDVRVHMEPDSGADVNIMDEHQFKALIHRSEEEITLKASSCILHALQKELHVKGEFNTVVRNKTRGANAKFVVVKGRIESPPLLCKNTLDDLGMLEIREDGSLREENDLKIKTLHATNTKEDERCTSKIVEEYKHVFEGIGRICDPKTKEDIQITLPMKEEAIPVAQKPRPVPYYLQNPLKELLDKGVKDGMYEKCKTDQPITWCSPLVVQPKPRFKSVEKEDLRPDMIRASTDLRVPNKFMERSRIIQGPTVEDFVHKFHECSIFSKLDLRQGYQQLVLDEKSREVTTFSTPWGNYRPKRLAFGAKTSQDVFDETMFRIFGDIPRCLNQRDDILIGGRNMSEHDETLRTVLQRASDYGVTMNREKCRFGVREIEFYGYLFTEGKLKPTPEKVRAVTESEAPSSKEEVRSFLGMTGYLSKFVPRYASITAPLRLLTRQDVKFHWGNEEEKAFQELKKHITSDSTVVFFNPRRPITVRVEASYHEGLSAGLFQETELGMQPVHYISRTMTDTEKRYSQTEKDALAVKWAKQRLRMYLLGAPRFKIVTAHKPLIPMFSKATAKLPPRIEKWVMDMQDADYEMVYEPGKDAADPLDFLSRHPLPETGNDSTEKVVKSIVQTEHAVVLVRVVEETAKDVQLQKVMKRILSEDWEYHKKDADLAPFYGIRGELSIIDGMVFRLHRIVIPRCLQRIVIKAGHSLGHLGSTKTKRMLREKYWFPNMDSMVEMISKQCYECQVATKDHRQEPVKVTSIPEKPWEVVAIDFGGPYPDGHYNLVVIDKRTRFPAVETLSSTAMEPTKKKLKKIWATHGTPRRVESDNGPPFNSKEFRDFAAEEGFHHHRITPLHPRANGEAENFMKLLNKTEQIAHLQGKDSGIAVQDMLIGYRSTPHPATGVPPYKALMNREVRTKLDFSDNSQDKYYNIINNRDALYKWKMKENAENRNTKEHNFIISDYVLLKQMKRNKWSTAYEPSFYVVIRISGSTVTARRVTDGREITRDSSQFKLVNAVMEMNEEFTEDQHDWREDVLRNACSENIPTDKISTVGDVTDTPDETESTIPDTPLRPTRPVRNRRRPEYLNDFVC